MAQKFLALSEADQADPPRESSEGFIHHYPPATGISPSVARSALLHPEIFALDPVESDLPLRCHCEGAAGTPNR
jgi:hypothetical protein